ncbi:MAG: YitT family protein [Clostridiaceae bacterium]|jgi:uncharacterized membrane-anchored protein YitT (DUF2179 family)|nr:YitT family protein [Clostridiaceae bacterium]
MDRIKLLKRIPPEQMKGFLADTVRILIGSFLVAMALNIFIVPSKIAPGGVTGLSTILFHVFGGIVPLGVIMIVLNVPLFLAALKLESKSFMIKTLFATLALAVITDVTVSYVERVIGPLMEAEFDALSDMPVTCLIGGLVMGIGLGLTVKSGGTTGGTDLAAALIKRYYPKVSFGKMLFLIDGFVVVLSMIAFSSIRLGMYAIITLIAQTQVLDAMQEGVDFSKAVYVVSDRYEEISELVMKELDRGVTALQGTGMYSGKEKKVLFIVVSGKEVPHVINIIKRVDMKAFVIISDAREILGEGFSKLD